jgi:hypothetical protein
MDYQAFAVEYPWIYNHLVAASPTLTDVRITNEQNIDPNQGSCYAWQAPGSRLLGSGKNGANIGARLDYIFINGVKQPASATNRLWDVTTGAWLWGGATVSGINDLTGTSLKDVHQRLNINSSGCSFPIDY